MKVAVTSLGNKLESMVEQRFGRCPYFVLVETDTMEVEVIQNTGVGFAHGAGVGSSQLLASKGVKAVITGNLGPNAYSALKTAQINAYTSFSGTVLEAIEKFKVEQLKEFSTPTVEKHAGTGVGGMGRGQGRGRVN
jgi:predicted Fe-Mo cluster-binding NifX family protein